MKRGWKEVITRGTVAGPSECAVLRALHHPHNIQVEEYCLLKCARQVTPLYVTTAMGERRKSSTNSTRRQMEASVQLHDPWIPTPPHRVRIEYEVGWAPRVGRLKAVEEREKKVSLSVIEPRFLDGPKW